MQDEVIRYWGGFGICVVMLTTGIAMLWKAKNKADKEHADERSVWLKKVEDISTATNNTVKDIAKESNIMFREQSDKTNLILRENSNILTGLKTLLENQR